MFGVVGDAGREGGGMGGGMGGGVRALAAVPWAAFRRLKRRRRPVARDERLLVQSAVGAAAGRGVEVEGPGGGGCGSGEWRSEFAGGRVKRAAAAGRAGSGGILRTKKSFRRFSGFFIFRGAACDMRTTNRYRSWTGEKGVRQRVDSCAAAAAAAALVCCS
jgi:hypothetical protein